MNKTLRNLSVLGGLTAVLLLATLANRAAAARAMASEASLAHEAALVAEAAARLDDDHSELEEAMEVMEDELRVLRKSLKDEAKNVTSLKSIVSLQAAVSKAKLATPAMTEGQPAEKRADFVKEYRRLLIDMSRKLLDLEELVLDNKLEEAGALFKEIRRFEDSGHERFTEDG